mgnify:FL=1
METGIMFKQWSLFNALYTSLLRKKIGDAINIENENVTLFDLIY